MLDLKLLIVDDEVDLCFLLSKALSKHIKHIDSAHTLSAGIIKFNLLKHDWLILDNNLPDGKGWDNLPEFISKNPFVNIICISANPDSIVEENKFVTKLIKPLNVDTVIELVKRKMNQP